MKRISNAETGAYVTRREAFTNNNQTMYGEWEGQQYTAYSYGDHFPMYVWSEGQWFENGDRYRSTTSKHMTQARPTRNTIKLKTRHIYIS